MSFKGITSDLVAVIFTIISWKRADQLFADKAFFC
jgi:hypothetical protein